MSLGVFQTASSQALLLSLLLFLSGCSWFGGDDDELIADSGEQQMYREAQRHLKNENFSLAVRSLQGLESRYPFGRYAEQAQLELIYAHYSAYEFAAANEAADRFIRLHPRHPNVDYAYLHERVGGLRHRAGILFAFYPSDDTKRDVSHIQTPLREFANCWRAFPIAPMPPMRGKEWCTCGTCWRGTKFMSPTITSAAAPTWPH